jgi:RhtB (resistance to homoserine/threonine) family protein
MIKNIELIAIYLPSIISLTCLQVITLISPGPDFAIIVRNSLVYSRRTALLTALGISLGIMLHVSYIMLGVGLVIAKTTWLFNLFKYIGAGYLLYIGYKGILAKKHALNFKDINHTIDISAAAALKSGFLTNALNPKAMLFFLSILTMMVSPSTPLIIMIIYGIIIFLTTVMWFSFVALCLSGKMRKVFSSYSHWIERVTGSLLLLLGIKLLFTNIG